MAIMESEKVRTDRPSLRGFTELLSSPPRMVIDPKWRILPHQSAVLQKEHCIATRTHGTWIGGQEKEEGDTGHSSVCMSLPS